MPFDRAPLAAGEQTETLIEALSELRRAQHRHTGRSQLQCQRDPIESPDHFGDRGRVGVRDRENPTSPPPPARPADAPRRCSTPRPGHRNVAARAMARPRCVHRRCPNPRGSSRAPPAPDTAPRARAPTRPPRPAGARSCRAPTAALSVADSRPACPAGPHPVVASPRTPPRPRRPRRSGREPGPAPPATHRHETRARPRLPPGTPDGVLPTPPTPVNVTIRASRTSAASSATSRSRPTNELCCTGRLPGSASNDCNAGNSRASPGATTWNTSTGCARSRRRCSPRPIEFHRITELVTDELLHRTSRQHLTPVRDRHQTGGTIHRRAVVVTIPFFARAGVHTHANEELHPALVCLDRRWLAAPRPRHPARRRAGRTPRETHRRSSSPRGRDATRSRRARSRRDERARPSSPPGCSSHRPRRALEIGEQERHRPRRQLDHGTPNAGQDPPQW